MSALTYTGPIVRTLLTTVVLSTLGGCTGQPPCAATDGCPGQTICDLDGTCRPLSASAAAARFVRRRRLAPTDWAVITGARGPRPDDDTLELGGGEGAQVLLAFGPLPPGDPAAATLTVSSHPTSQGPESDAHVTVYRVAPFQGERVTRSERPAVLGSRVLTRLFPRSYAHALRFDVTEAVRAAQAAAERSVSLLLILNEPQEGPPWQLASPRAAAPELRPSLDLLLQ